MLMPTALISMPIVNKKQWAVYNIVIVMNN